jgi:5'-nucleotidase
MAGKNGHDGRDEQERPLLLVTNDDGIEAPGIRALCRRLERVAEVVVVAPDREQSAVSHSISLSRPLRVHGSAGRFSVSGSPVDSVLMGLVRLCPRRPALVISGINEGLNVGTDIFYSGTVAAALEGAIHDVPGLALSQELPGEDEGATGLEQLFDRTAEIAVKLVDRLLVHPLPPRCVLNVNAPAVMTDRICWTRMGRRTYRERVEQRFDLRGNPYFWLGGPLVRETSPPGTDAHAVESSAISLTLLKLDLTAEPPTWYDRWSLDGYQTEEGPDGRSAATGR